jgi:hypothetical protein
MSDDQWWKEDAPAADDQWWKEDADSSALERLPGLTGRAILNAIASPAVLSEHLANKFRTPEHTWENLRDRAADALHLPQPQTGTERFTQSVAQSAPAFALPGTVGAQVAGGAALGAVEAPAGREGPAALLGAALGAAGPAAARALEGFRPAVGTSAATLRDAGVPLTVGQTVGENGLAGQAAKAVEDRIVKSPVAGYALRGRRDDALAGWRQATRNAAVPGATSLDDMETMFAHEYDRLVDGIGFAPSLSERWTAADVIRNLSDDFAPGTSNRDVAALGRFVADHMPRGNAPADYQAAETALRAKAQSYARSTAPGSDIAADNLGRAADSLRALWRSGLEPAKQAELSALDRQYAAYVPLRDAGAKVTETYREAYTPKQLIAALQARDPTKGKTRWRNPTQGQLATAGEEVIGSAPTKGTTLGGAAELAGVLTLPGPVSAALAGATNLYGLRPIQNILTGNNRVQQSAFVAALAEALRRSGAAAQSN